MTANQFNSLQTGYVVRRKGENIARTIDTVYTENGSRQNGRVCISTVPDVNGQLFIVNHNSKAVAAHFSHFDLISDALGNAITQAGQTSKRPRRLQ